MFKHTHLVLVILLLLVAALSPNQAQSKPFLQMQLRSPQIADRFDFPLGAPDGTDFTHYTWGGGWGNGYDMRNNALTGGTCFGVDWSLLWHAGIDWFRAGATSTAGEPVTAVANGRVVERHASYNPGETLVIEHTLPDGGLVYSMYGHLANVTVQENQEVQRGVFLGTVYPQTNIQNSHLHWEIRSMLDAGSAGSQPCYDPNVFLPGPGYTYPEHPGELGYYDPVAFITNHRAIEDQSNVTVSLIVDATGSMQDNDPYGLRKEAAKTFIDTVNIGDRLAVVAFNTLAYHLGPLRTIEDGSDRLALKNAVNQIGSSGYTDLNVGLNAGFDELLSDNTDNRKAAVFLTDGLQEGSGPYNYQSHMQYAARDWPIYSVGLGDNLDLDLLQEIAQDTGGTFTHLEQANDLQGLYFELAQAINQQAAALNQNFRLMQFSTQLVPVSIQPNQMTATFFTAWAGSDVSTSLLSPNGRLITPSSDASDIYHVKGATYEIFTVAYPTAGTWTMQVYGASLPPGGEEVNARVAVAGPRSVYLPVVVRQFQPAEPPPITPHNPTPANGATTQPLSLVLAWQGGDSDGDTVTYDVYFGFAPDRLFPIALGQSASALYPGPLSYATDYYWQVVSKDPHGATVAGPIWVFTTMSQGATPTPSITPSTTPGTTATPTPSATLTRTPTATTPATSTATATATSTSTSTPTPVPTSTATPTPAATFTPTPTNTPTATPTLTPTPTNTPMPSPTPTPTIPAPPPPAELLGPFTNNGGFELGNMSGWITLNGTVDVNGEFVHSGIYSVHGSSGGDESDGQPPVIFYRDISLEPYRVWIDNNLAHADYEGWLNNGNSEWYRYVVRFYSSSGTVLATYDTGWIHNAGGGYHEHGEQRLIPVNSSFVRIEAQMKRNQFDYTDVDVDDLRFYIWFSNP